MKKPTPSKVIIAPNPQKPKQEEVAPDLTPVENAPAPAQAPAQQCPPPAEEAAEEEE